MSDELKPYDHAAPRLSTGEAAEMLHLSQQTVIRMMDGGHMRAHRVPFSRFRRTYVTAVVDFAMENGVPLERGDIDRVLLKPAPYRKKTGGRKKEEGTDASHQATD